jgi:4-diphosphocytidyl-2-C-methyl-D-erythritol kinase
MPASYLNCPAPAKLNLFLHINGRRPDGYHLLQTVFQLIDRCDTLDFTVRDDGVIHRENDVPGVPEQDDLVVRAAKLLQKAAACPQKGANIRVHKVLPMGGGLGGGSSDAATTLMVLNHLWECDLSRDALMALGLQLGADVPFFIFGENAFAEGVGEALLPIKTANCWFIVIEPGVSVPTVKIFSDKQLTRDTKTIRITDFPDANTYLVKGFGKNDLEDVATKHFPEVAAALNWAKQFGNAMMTGSGACIFCPFENEQQADAVLAQLPPTWKAWKTQAMSKHPLANLIKL